MSDAPDPSKAAVEPDTGEAFTRMAAYGRNERPKTGWGPLVLIFVLLIPLGAVGWVAWQQMEFQRELAALRADNAALQELSTSSSSQFAEVQQRQQELDTALEQRQQDFDTALQQERQELDAALQQTLQQELAASEAATTAQVERLARMERELAALQTEVAETQLLVNESGNEDAGTPLVEAELLLRFAQQRLVLARDTATAVELFLAADEVLRTVEDPAVIAVRNTLAQEVATLQAVPEVDVAGLFAQLSAQSARVESFTAVSEGSVQDFSVSPPAASAAEPAIADDGWWTGVKQTFGQYFVVTQSTAEIVPQLSASEQFQLRALVQLKIEQAKLALLQSEPELYKTALDDAVGTARRWLRGTEGSVEEFATALTTLRNTPIVAELPPAGQTLAALRALSGVSTAPVRSEAPPAVPVAQQ